MITILLNHQRCRHIPNGKELVQNHIDSMNKIWPSFIYIFIDYKNKQHKNDIYVSLYINLNELHITMRRIDYED